MDNTIHHYRRNSGVNLLSKDFQTGKTSGTLDITEGENVVVTATINIGVSNPSTDLTLGTSMQHSTLQSNMYWATCVNELQSGKF